jgi:hypothetical protein
MRLAWLATTATANGHIGILSRQTLDCDRWTRSSTIRWAFRVWHFQQSVVCEVAQAAVGGGLERFRVIAASRRPSQPSAAPPQGEYWWRCRDVRVAVVEGWSYRRGPLDPVFSYRISR